MMHLLISAAHKSSGKTTLTLGLCAALAKRGQRVRPFKKGPDYIDPLWLTEAAGHPCYNLDFHTMTSGEMVARLAHDAEPDSIALIEGNKGLHDGLSLEGIDSNAALAKLTGSPVVLVIDTRGMTRGIAPLLLGYQQFDPQIMLGGVILNHVGGRRHEGKLRQAVEHYTDIPVLGAVHRDPQLEIAERHQGLIPANERDDAAEIIGRVAQRIAAQVDLAGICELARHGPALPTTSTGVLAATSTGPRVRIGIARDAAFGFYYPDDLEALERAGGDLIPVDTLNDTMLPDVDGLFIGGGFPERHMAALEANTSLRAAVREAVESGLPVYAECGGLMYLTRSLTWQGHRCQMAGALPADTLMHERPQGRGYTRLHPTGSALWPTAPGGQSDELAAHEFHYSSLENLDPSIRYAYEVRRGTGIDGVHDGIVYKNTLACYAHLRNTSQSPWAERFVAFVRDHAARTTNAAAAAPA